MRIILAIACFQLLSCDLEFLESIEFWKDKSPVIAEVEDSRLSIDALKEANALGDSVSKEEWVSQIEHWVDFEVMHREAIKRGLQKDPVVRKLVKDAERKILVDRLRMNINLSDSSAAESEKEILEYYEANKAMFRIESLEASDSLAEEYIPISDVQEQIRNIIRSEKHLAREKRWLNEIKNNYTIEVYPKYLDSL